MRTAWVALAALSLAAHAEEPDADDPIGRMEAARSGDSGIRTPEMQEAILRAAQAEAQKAAAARFRTAAAVAGSAWVNIGPTTADFEKNGGTYFKVDSGRARKILVDPRDANVVYLATSGGGVWKTRDALSAATGAPHWSPITDGIVSLSIGSIAMNPANADSLVLGLGDPFDVQTPGHNILTSDDGGTTWSAAAKLSGSYPGNAAVYTATSVRDIGFDPGGATVLVATDAGLFRHTNGGVGTGWALVDVDSTTHDLQDCWSLAWAGTGGTGTWVLGSRDEFASGVPGKLWQSTDGGAHWTDKTSGLAGEGTDVGRITVTAAQSGPSTWRVYALAANKAQSDQKDVFRSNDSGASWSSLGMHGCMSSTAGYCTGESPVNPTEGGPITNPATDPHPYPHQLDLDFIHDQASYNHMLVVDPLSPDTLFIGGNLAMGRSTDGGATWTVMTDWLPIALTGTGAQNGGLDTSSTSPQYAHADWHTATIAHVGGVAYFWGGHDGGVTRATSNFLTAAQGSVAWDDKANKGIVSHLVYSVASGKERPGTTCAAGGGDIVYGGFQDNGTRLRVLSGATQYVSYNQIVGGDGFGVGLGCTAAAAAMGSQLLSTYVQRISTSSNGGSSFTTRVSQPGSGTGSCSGYSATTACAVGLSSPSIVMGYSANFRMKVVADLTTDFTYLTPITDNITPTAQGYVYRSTDNGVSWQGINGVINLEAGGTASIFPRQMRNVASHPKKAGAYAAVSGGRAYVTTDSGATWYESKRAVAGSGANYLSMASIAFDPNDSTGGTVWIASPFTSLTDGTSPATGHLFKCTGAATAAGATCTAMSNGIDPVLPINVVKVDPGDSNTIYAGTEIGMYRSTDGGANFSRYGTNLPLVSVTDIAINADGSALRVSTFGRGFWEIYPSTGAAGVAGNGDLDFSGVIDGFDLVREAAIEFNDRTTPDFSAAGDVAFNNVIDESDLATLLLKLGGTP